MNNIDFLLVIGVIIIADICVIEVLKLFHKKYFKKLPLPQLTSNNVVFVSMKGK